MAAVPPTPPIPDRPLATLPAGLPRPARGPGRPGAGVVHAPGRAARCPSTARSAASGSILDAIRDPELSAEITLQPVRRYGVDAAILYSDIVVPVAAIGFGVDVAPGVGPGRRAARSPAPPTSSACARSTPRPTRPYVLETVRILAKELAGPADRVRRRPVHRRQLPDRGSARRAPTPAPRRSCTASPRCGTQLMERLADLAIASLRSQVDAGAVGRAALRLAGPARSSPADYERFVLPHSRRVFDEVADLGVPRIHFGVGTGELLGLMASAGADVVGVDWRVPLDEARRRVPAGPGPAGQPRPGPVPGPVGGRGRRGARRPAPATAAIPATCSTSATACCPRPTRRCSSGSSSSCTPKVGATVRSAAASPPRRSPSERRGPSGWW